MSSIDSYYMIQMTPKLVTCIEYWSDEVISMNQKYAMAEYPDYGFPELYLTMLFATKFNRS